MLVANRLTDGRVVFYTKDGDWSPELDNVLVAEDQALEDALAAAQVDEASNLVVSLEPVEADVTQSPPHPKHIKHAMQSTGPSVRLDLGYQTGTDWENRTS